MTPPLPRTLFVGKGAGSVCWYRCALPAMALGVEWVGTDGEPPDLVIGTGLARNMTFKDFFDYDVLVVQQPVGPAWIRAIRDLQAAGVVVLFELDDYVHAVRKMKDHEFAHLFNKDKLAAYELSMRICDGIVVSTDYLAQRYRAFNENVWVCRNGLDLKRYEVTRPAREQVNVGWAGGTGHRDAIRPWLTGLRELMRERADVGFFSVGQPFAFDFQEEFGEARAVALPFSELHSYPSAMASFDVAIAPAGKGNFFRGKSDLRWLESGALGIPVIADPDVYPDIDHGVTGFHASTPAEARELLGTLVADAELRDRVGSAARAHVREHRSAQAVSGAWVTAIQAAAGRPAVRAA